MPVLHDGDLAVWESLAICEYAAERFPAARLWPDDPAARAVARAVACEMHAGFGALRDEHPMDICARTPKAPSSAAAADIARIGALWRDARSRFGGDGPYLFGRFSIADAMFAPVVSRFRTYAIEMDATCETYTDTIWSLPAMREWCALAAAEIDGTG